MPVRSHALPMLPLRCFEIQWFSALQVLCQHSSSLLQDLSKALPQLSYQQTYVKKHLTVNRNAALCCQGTQVKHQTQRGSKTSGSSTAAKDGLVGRLLLPCPAIPASAAWPPDPFGPGHVVVPLLPAHTSALLRATAMPQSCSWCICFDASADRQQGAGPAARPAGAGDTTHVVPAPLGTAEVCFSARRGAQICCLPRGAGKQ